jgi:nucleoid-associated protein YgaU
LAHARILTLEDRAQIEAKRENEVAPAEKNAPEAADAQALPPDASLGEVARHYRKQKEARQAQQSAQFHLPFGDAVLASPVAPLHAGGVPVAPELETPHFAPPTASSRMVASMNSTKRWNIVSVRRGDSLWKLAQQNLGYGNRWHELLAANPWIANPDRIEAGRHVNVPAKMSVSRSSSKIIVQRGDTLSKIALREFAHATHWRCIARANPNLRKPDHIYEGQELVLPGECGRLTAQPLLNWTSIVTAFGKPI